MIGLVREVRVDGDTTLSELLGRSDVLQSRIVTVINDKMKSREFPVDFATSGCRAELRIGDLLPRGPLYLSRGRVPRAHRRADPHRLQPASSSIPAGFPWSR